MTASDVQLSVRTRYEIFVERKPASLIRRLFFTFRHLFALAIGGAWAELRSRRERRMPRKWRYGFLRLVILPFRPFVDGKLIRQPFGVQLRIRLEKMGATYIKLGQILSLREDMLPAAITDELKKLLDTLPAVPFPRVMELIQENLDRPWREVFVRINEIPLGSASVAQAHHAVLMNGDEVVIKLMKPGTRELIRTDSRILKGLGRMLQWIIPAMQPKAMLEEFCEYTNREVDFRLEAHNAEEFRRNFRSHPEVRFPKVYREHSTADMLVMEYIRGMKPDAQTAALLTDAQKHQVVDIGAFAIIKMLYNDGFFHADLHPGNLLIVNESECAFIDLGMVGRFSEATRKNMLYYYNALVLGNAEAAARYLSLVAKPGHRADVEGFRKEFIHVANNWLKHPNFHEFSLARLILESTRLGARYGMYFPMEMVLMVKAMITFEGVGHVIQPDLNIADVSRKHIRRLLIREVKPMELLKASLQNAPEFLDTMTRTPGLMVEIFNRLEQELNQKKAPRMQGMKVLILGGFAFLGACVLYGTGAEPWISGALLVIALLLVWRSS